MSSAIEIRRLVTRGGRPLDFTLLGFGSAPLGNYLQPLDESACDRTVEAAWDCGIRYFDTAPFYGLSLAELRVGRVLRALPRDRFLISTKVGRALVPCAEGEQKPELFVNTPPYRVEFDYSYDGVVRSFEGSLRRLGLTASTSSSCTTSMRWFMAIANGLNGACANCSITAAGARSTCCAPMESSVRSATTNGSPANGCSSSRTPICSCLRAATRCSSNRQSTPSSRSVRNAARAS